MLQQLQLGLDVSPAAADASDARVQVLSGVQLGIALAAVAALVAWCHRAYQNVHWLPDAHPEYSESMGWAGWLIPILNLWYPYKIMLEIGQYIGGLGDARRPEVRSRWDLLVVGWWALSICVVVMSRVGYLMAGREPGTLPALLTLTRVLLASQLCTLLGAAATLAVLRTLAGPEGALGRHQQAADGSPLVG